MVVSLVAVAARGILSRSSSRSTNGSSDDSVFTISSHMIGISTDSGYSSSNSKSSVARRKYYVVLIVVMALSFSAS